MPYKKGFGLVLRKCAADGTSRNGFRWPKRGPVACPDWEPTDKCGNGLHGLLWGGGDASLLSGEVWQAVEVRLSECIDLGGKVKFPKGRVVLTGTREAVTGLIYENAPKGSVVHFLSLTGGYASTLTGGAYSTLTGGDRSTLTGGAYSTLTGGYASTLTGGAYSTLTGGAGSTLTGGTYSTLTGGDGSTLTGGYASTLTGGAYSTLTGGDRSTLTGGAFSTLTGGDGSTLTGGYTSTLTGGDGSTLTGGDRSTLTGGAYSTLIWRTWDGGRYRITVAYVAENGVKANTPYALVEGVVTEQV